MKTRFAILLGTTLIALTVHSQTNSVGIRTAGDYPLTGMGMAELAACIDALKPQFPAEARIVGINVINERKVTIRTGRVEGPLGGTGELRTFELIDGQWVSGQTARWAS